MADAFDFTKEFQEYRDLRSANDQRNKDFWTMRQAFKGIWPWASDWPAFKPKLRVNLLRKLVLTHAAFLVGRQFTWAVDPLGSSAAQRKKATEAERALIQIWENCGAWAHVNRAAALGSLLGTGGFKTYMDEDRACVTAIQPELIYPVTRGDNYMALDKVFYAYNIDRLTAERQYKRPADSFKSAREVEEQYKGPNVFYRTLNKARGDSRGGNFVVTGNYAGSMPASAEARRIPVIEVWEKDRYALFVGGEQIENGANPYGFIPYTLIPNIDAGYGIIGESDVDQLLDLNQELNEMLSDWAYTMKRWANPTLLWQRAPHNYLDLVNGILGGGGVLSLPPNSDVRFLEYTGKPPDFDILLQRFRDFGIEVSGLNEQAVSGAAGGSVNTGASMTISMTNVVATQSLKQTLWSQGMMQVGAQMLELGSRMSEIGVTEAGAKSKDAPGKELTGDTIGAHRRARIAWPGLLPKDSEAAARLEIEKMQAGAQSKYSTIEALGAQFPEDEIARIREEGGDRQLMDPRSQAAFDRNDVLAGQMQGGQPGQGDPSAAMPDDIEGDQDVQPSEGDLEGDPELMQGFAQGGDGQVRASDGRVLDETGGDLTRFFAQQGNGARPMPPQEDMLDQGDEDFAAAGGA